MKLDLPNLDVKLLCVKDASSSEGGRCTLRSKSNLTVDHNIEEHRAVGQKLQDSPPTKSPSSSPSKSPIVYVPKGPPRHLQRIQLSAPVNCLLIAPQPRHRQWHLLRKIHLSAPINHLQTAPRLCQRHQPHPERTSILWVGVVLHMLLEGHPLHRLLWWPLLLKLL